MLLWNPVLKTTLKILLIYFPLFALEGPPELSLWNAVLTSFSVGGYRSFGPPARILWLILTFHHFLIFVFRLSRIVLNYCPITNFLLHFLLFSLSLYGSICQRWMHWFYYRNTTRVSAWGGNNFSTVWQIVKRTAIYMYIKVKVNVKFTPEQARKAQRGSRGIALLFL